VSLPVRMTKRGRGRGRARLRRTGDLKGPYADRETRGRTQSVGELVAGSEVGVAVGGADEWLNEGNQG
jgi:hypothetical protein